MYQTKVNQTPYEEKPKTLKTAKEALKSVRAIVFDLDGTLTDSEGLYRRFWVEAARMLGYPMEPRHALMIRSMAPELLVTDEIGGAGDLFALQEAARCGVAVLASAHAAGLEELSRRPQLKGILSCGVFERFVVLGQSPGKVLGVYDGEGRLCRCAL